MLPNLRLYHWTVLILKITQIRWLFHPLLLELVIIFGYNVLTNCSLSYILLIIYCPQKTIYWHKIGGSQYISFGEPYKRGQ